MARPKIRGQARDYSHIDVLTWVRFAAFLDGEGHIGINRNKTKRGVYDYLMVIVTNTDPRLIRWLIETFGGSVRRGQRKSPKHRMVFKWGVSCRDAEALLRGCLPYLLLKHDQAQIALAFQETIKGYRRGNPLPSGVADLRTLFRSQLVDARWAQHPIDDLCPPAVKQPVARTEGD